MVGMVRGGPTLAISQRGYVLETGTIILDGKASDLVNNDPVRQAYLGG